MRRSSQCSRGFGLAVAVAVSILGCGVQESAKSGISRTGAETAADVRAKFEILRGPRELLPNSVRQALERSDEQSASPWAQAVTTNHPRVWAVANQENLCLLSLEHGVVGTVCSTPAAAITRGIAITLLAPEAELSRGRERLIVGLVPDGKRALVAHSGDQTTRIEAVHGIVSHADTVGVAPNWFSVE